MGEDITGFYQTDEDETTEFEVARYLTSCHVYGFLASLNEI